MSNFCVRMTDDLARTHATLSVRAWQTWCSREGVSFLCEDCVRPFHMAKWKAFWGPLPVVYVDSDTLPNPAMTRDDLASLVARVKFVAACRTGCPETHLKWIDHFQPRFSGVSLEWDNAINAGVVIAQPDAFPIIQRVWDLGVSENVRWDEIFVQMALLGMGIEFEPLPRRYNFIDVTMEPIERLGAIWHACGHQKDVLVKLAHEHWSSDCLTTDQIRVLG